MQYQLENMYLKVKRKLKEQSLGKKVSQTSRIW